jgi:hypothetical protein
VEPANPPERRPGGAIIEITDTHETVKLPSIDVDETLQQRQVLPTGRECGYAGIRAIVDYFFEPFPRCGLRIDGDASKKIRVRERLHEIEIIMDPFDAIIGAFDKSCCSPFYRMLLDVSSGTPKLISLQPSMLRLDEHCGDSCTCTEVTERSRAIFAERTGNLYTALLSDLKIREGIDLYGKDRELWNVLVEMLCAMESMKNAENAADRLRLHAIDRAMRCGPANRLLMCAAHKFIMCKGYIEEVAVKKFSEYFAEAVERHSLSSQINELHIKSDGIFTNEFRFGGGKYMTYYITQKVLGVVLGVHLAHPPSLTLLRDACHSRTISSALRAFRCSDFKYSNYDSRSSTICMEHGLRSSIICMGSECHRLLSAIADIAIECAELALDYIVSDDFIPDHSEVKLREGQKWTEFLREEFGQIGNVDICFESEHGNVQPLCEKFFGDSNSAIETFNRSIAEVYVEMIEKRGGS